MATITLNNGNTIEYKRINNDINGNPRYLIHFLDLLLENETRTLAYALSKAKKVGGRKYRGNDFGGGIVITSYNLKSDLERIFS